ncbi:MAG TPA: DUF58 domain-containing protein [Clostridiaceae bacterium]|nr:DUF58 domain-containing protein [Clostridiaceae bacterium]
MSQLFDSSFMKKIQQLTLNTKFTLDGTHAGNRKSRSKGVSVEFSDYREYVPGDDFRHIDWNAYGRFEKLFIKLFMEEREAPVTIFLDVSKSMDWGEPNKSIASRRLTAALSYISLSNFDKVSVACFDEQVRENCRNLRGKFSFHRITNLLENVTYTGSSNIQKAIENFQMQWNRGITVIISDFFSQGSFSQVLKYLKYNKQVIYICHILSPQEIHPEFTESIRLLDSETGEILDITLTPALLSSYSKALKQFEENIKKDCIKWGAYYFNFSSDTTIEEMVKEVTEG